MRLLKRIIKKSLKIPYCFVRWLILQPFCIVFYDRKYLKGRWFDDGIFSLGWDWCWVDVWHRIFFGKHLFIRHPVSPYIDCTAEIIFHPDDLNNLNGSGNYFQGFDGGRITIGKGSYIAKNVGIITVNHDLNNPDLHQEPKGVILGEQCWIGMNAMILPGVHLGPHTIVGAGAVVTKSFSEGWCVVAGNPARKIKEIRL